VTPIDGAGAVPAGGGSSLPSPGGPGIDPLGTPFELLQTKHHIKKIGDLTDSSPDLWKTLRVWAEKVRADPSLPSRIRFALFTTGCAPEGSAASLLRPSLNNQPRNVELALSLLNTASIASKNIGLTSAFAAFAELASEMQSSLLGAIDVLDQAPTVVDLDKVIEDRLKMIAPRGKAHVAREQLEGWWWARVAKSLTDSSAALISVLELEARIDDIREVMRRESIVQRWRDGIALVPANWPERPAS